MVNSFKINSHIFKTGLKILILIFLSVIIGCSSKEDKVNDTYNSIVKIINSGGFRTTTSHITGSVQGKARIQTFENSISHRYTVPGYNWYTSKGVELTSFKIHNDCGFSDCIDYINYSLSARYEPDNDGPAELIITVTKDNLVKLYLFGESNWKSWKTWDMGQNDTISKLLKQTYIELNE
jgi:hypothetical protein